MRTYKVWFTKYFEYDVEADSEDEATDLAYDLFCAEQRMPIANTSYDEVEVEECE